MAVKSPIVKLRSVASHISSLRKFFEYLRRRGENHDETECYQDRRDQKREEPYRLQWLASLMAAMAVDTASGSMWQLGYLGGVEGGAGQPSPFSFFFLFFFFWEARAGFFPAFFS